ncbi:MAG TPA: YccF domain-containing protein [Cytophagales bacterium]|nr:YccF domain-containing protein [Cytophagales bacterium]HAA17905.1 YccF domain-containing protein [Cytophagales bacterium]HAP58173.1 YccF domain-containing protein [Cytophagales bacterium]
MKLLGNLIWFIFGGVFIAIEYIIASLLMMITIIGIPFGIQNLKLAAVALWPFGKEIRRKETGSGFLYFLMNVLWLILGGVWIALTHIGFGVIFYITIIGIPFGNQHFKLAWLALFPFGKEVV